MDIQKYRYFEKKNWVVSKWGRVKKMIHDFQFRLHCYKHPTHLDYSKILKGSIPILVNNFNRLDVLEKMVDWLQELDGEKSIIIVDNLSTFPALLDYYHSLNAENIQVVKLGYNSGTMGLHLIGEMVKKNYSHFVLTDSDLLPYPDTPSDILPYLKYMLNQEQSFNHVGLSLEIDDLPDCYPLKEKVTRWESQFWNKDQMVDKIAYIAPIDTTFAMYRKTSQLGTFYDALRLARPYTLKHVDWYVDPENLTKEYIYYLKTCRNIATWAKEYLEIPQEVAVKSV